MQIEALRIKRVYDEPAADDGCRVLVDRLWPRGVGKDAARIDVWAKDAAPSTELRKWFHAGGDEAEFAARYEAELADSGAIADLREQLAGRDPVTLVTAAKEPYAHARVLRDLLAGGDA